MILSIMVGTVTANQWRQFLTQTDLDAKFFFSLPTFLLAITSHLVSKPPQCCICALKEDDDKDRKVIHLSAEGGIEDHFEMNVIAIWRLMVKTLADLKFLIGVLKSTSKLFKLRSQTRRVAGNICFRNISFI